jgi:hypothetical protein
VLDRISTHPARRIEELLPDRWKALRQASVATIDGLRTESRALRDHQGARSYSRRPVGKEDTPPVITRYPAALRTRFTGPSLFFCRQAGCRMGETPILFENRRTGVSKISTREAIEALRVILQLGISRVLGRTHAAGWLPARLFMSSPPRPYADRFHRCIGETRFRDDIFTA